MSASDGTSPRSAKAAAARPGRRAGEESSSRPARNFRLGGPSIALDPAIHAYRPDLADIALAGKIIAPHYARALDRTALRDVDLFVAPKQAAELVAALKAGELFAVLEYAGGWAWGYAKADHRVGYVPADALGA